MAKNAMFTGNWNHQNKKVDVNLPMIIFEEDGCQVMYCPALDISGYGKTEQEAFSSFEVCISEFFLYTLNKGTFYEELGRMGWNIKKNKNKAITPPTLQHLLESNDNFSRIFNTHPFRKFDTNISLPAVA
jgi:hypothetical protein